MFSSNVWAMLVTFMYYFQRHDKVNNSGNLMLKLFLLRWYPNAALSTEHHYTNTDSMDGCS